jgi:hypothetical protein
MSQEKPETSGWIETLARAIVAWNRQDLDAFLETWHPDCEWRPAFPRSLEAWAPPTAAAMASHVPGTACEPFGMSTSWIPEDARVVGDRLVAVGHVRARKGKRAQS